MAKKRIYIKDIFGFGGGGMEGNFYTLLRNNITKLFSNIFFEFNLYMYCQYRKILQKYSIMYYHINKSV